MGTGRILRSPAPDQRSRKRSKLQRSKHRHGASRSGAAGLRRAGEGIDAAHGDGRDAPGAGRMLRKKWIARETAAAERDARRTERFAVLVPETRLPALTKMQQAILAELAACGGELPLAELRRRELPSSTLQTLVRRELVRIEERAAAFRLGGIEAPAQPLSLNEPQTEALASIVPQLGGFHPFLLHGVTGSGKTAVYLAGNAAGARSRAIGDSAGAGDRADAADGGAAGCGLWSSVWRCCTRRLRPKSAASSGGASIAARRRSWWARARRFLRRCRIWA